MTVLHRLQRDRRGATIVEFAILLPLIMTLICGAVEVGNLLLARVVLEGVVVDAARIATASLKSTQQQRDTAMRARITQAMSAFPLAKGQSITIQTKVYRKFGDAYPEPFTDQNKNNRYDLGEPYTDRNRNGQWDDASTVPNSAMGGAGDIVSITAVYPKAILFGFLASNLGLGTLFTLSATTVVRNEAVNLTQ